MNVIGAVISGVIGTFAMGVFIWFGSVISGMTKVNIVDYLGSILTPNSKTARWVGIAILSFDGAVLAIISAFLWEAEIGEATWFSAW